MRLHGPEEAAHNRASDQQIYQYNNTMVTEGELYAHH